VEATVSINWKWDQEFFHFIGNIFKGIFHQLILILSLWYKRHFIKFGDLPLFRFLALGITLDMVKEPQLYLHMVVGANFNSVQASYNKHVNFYNDAGWKQKILQLSRKPWMSVYTWGCETKKVCIRVLFRSKPKVYNFSINFVRTFGGGGFFFPKKLTKKKGYRMEIIWKILIPWMHVSILFFCNRNNSRFSQTVQPILLSQFPGNEYFQLNRSISDQNMGSYRIVYIKRQLWRSTLYSILYSA